MTRIEAFSPDLARDWKMFSYPGPGLRVVALEPPPCDVWIGRWLLNRAVPEMMKRNGTQILFTLENCTALYRVAVEEESRLGCVLVTMIYEHHALPPR